MKNFFSKLFGTVNDRKLKEFQPIVDKINLQEEVLYSAIEISLELGIKINGWRTKKSDRNI